MEEFKGKERAEKYSKGSGNIQSYSDYLNGYNSALEDSKAPEMLEMLQYIIEDSERGHCLDKEDLEDIKRLIKQATEHE